MMILAISGSLRASSSNTAMLRATVALAPPSVEVSLFGGIGNLPHFNPDLDGEAVSPFVTDFRIALRSADAVIFSVPEYAHGVPGVPKTLSIGLWQRRTCREAGGATQSVSPWNLCAGVSVRDSDRHGGKGGS